MTAETTTRASKTISWGLLDQIASSGSNFVFMIIAARALLPQELGAIAFAFELYLLSVLVSRGVAGDPLTSRFAGFTHELLRRPIKAATTAALLVAAVVGTGLAVSSIWVDMPLGPVLLVAAVAMPGLTLQDYVRTALIVSDRARSTFLNDAFWALLQLPFLWLAVTHHPSATSVFGAWAGTGVVAGLVGLVQLKCIPASATTLRPWLSETRTLWPFYVADNLLFQATSLLVVAIISATSGLAGLAGFRVAMTAYAPLSTVARGIMSVAVAMLARGRSDPEQVRKNSLLISSVLTPLPLVLGATLLLVPTAWGEALFGLSWREAEPLVFWAGFVSAAALFSAGVISGLRALGAGPHVLRARINTSIIACAFAAVGGVLGGVLGMFIALAVAFPLQSALWWFSLRRATTQALHDARQA